MTARRSVLQDWVADLTMMQQSVLLTAVRGPDGLPKYHPVKFVIRWYRRCVLLSSFMHQVIDNPVVTDGGSFLGPSVPESHMCCVECGEQPQWHDEEEAAKGENADWCDHAFVGEPSDVCCWEAPMNDRITAYLSTLDEVPHHFQLHLLHAAEIIGYKHPAPGISAWWLAVYHRLVHDMHLWPETEKQLDARLGDTREGWLARGDVATNA